MIKHEHLLDRPYKYGSADCYGLLMDLYKDNWDIVLTDFARPLMWEVKNPELDIVRKNYAHDGFVPVIVNRRTILPGDVLLLALGSSVICHCGVYLEGGRFIHHPFRARSRVDFWAGAYSDRTMIVVRHPQVTQDQTTTKIQMMDLVLPAKRDKYLATLKGTSGADPGLGRSGGAGEHQPHPGEVILHQTRGHASS